MEDNSSKIKLVQIVNTLAISDGGPARHAWELSNAINSLPNSKSELLYFVGSRVGSVFEAESEIRQEKNLKLPKKISMFKHSLLEINLTNAIRAIRDADALLLHGYYLVWSPLVAVVSRMCGTKILLIPHGSLTEWQSRTHPVRKKIWNSSVGRITRRLVTKFLVGSEQELRDLVARFPNMNVSVIGVGTKLGDIRENRSEIHNPVRLLSLSRISPKKQIELSIEATRKLLDQGFQVVLKIAGDADNDYGRKLENLVKELSLEANVKFLGQIEGNLKSDLLYGSDIFLLPSADENFGIAVAEAAAHGLPVVASAQVASAYLLRRPVRVILQANSSKHVADAIVEICTLDFPKLRLDAQLQASKVFTWEATALRLIGQVTN